MSIEDQFLADELLGVITNRFGDRWQITLEGRRLALRPHAPRRRAPNRPPMPEADYLLRRISATFGARGISTAEPLPIRWGRDTDLTISAIQALDPWLKDGINRVWREGFITQPVIRFTAERDCDNQLEPGYLTSFINLSCVQRIANVAEHAAIIDIWIEAMSAIGIHAGRLSIGGQLNVWRRGRVSGITLFLTCDGIAFADAVLLWHTGSTDHLATDLGSGLERIRWLLAQHDWAETVFGDVSHRWSLDLLDSIRTATLMVMAGIRPSSRGAGAALRRVLRPVPSEMAAAGLGRLVRAQRAYWTQAGMTGISWPHIATIIENEVLASRSQ